MYAVGVKSTVMIRGLSATIGRLLAGLKILGALVDHSRYRTKTRDWPGSVEMETIRNFQCPPRLLHAGLSRRTVTGMFQRYHSVHVSENDETRRTVALIICAVN